MTLLLGVMYTAIRKYALQALLVIGVVYGVYYYIESTNSELEVATKQAADLETDNQRLVDEVKDLREQSPIDTKAVSDHQTEQGALDVDQAVAIEKVQHEVRKALQVVPTDPFSALQVTDAVSTAVIDGMWSSYKGTVRRDSATKASK